jgi:hypothetical protein
MTEQKIDPDLLTRIIVLIYGMLETGGPCWIYAAVKPSKYEAFQNAQKAGDLDVHNFDGFGEIIVSGEGKSPPEEITLKVAEMYQTTLKKHMEDTEVKKEIKKKTEKKDS